jgi:hypothetical protein
VGCPPAAQPVEQRVGDRQRAVFVALASAHMNPQPLRVDVADLQRQPFAQTQAGAVEGDEEDPVAALADRAAVGSPPASARPAGG